MAAASSRAPRSCCGLVRVGGHRTDDGVRAGPPPARNLGLPASRHRRHPAGRRRSLRRLRTAGLAVRQHYGLCPDPPVRPRSAIGSLLLGMAGQIAYHLLAQARAAHAPWGITTAVSCLPVLVLGMGAALAHLLRADSHRTNLGGQAKSTHPADQAAGKDTKSRPHRHPDPARAAHPGMDDRDHAQRRRPAHLPALTARRRCTRLKCRTGRTRPPGHIPASQPRRVSGCRVADPCPSEYPITCTFSIPRCVVK